jgi:UDP-glucuronate 4-epimerase
VFNSGNSNPTPLMAYIEAIEQALGITASKEFLPMQPGDVPATVADSPVQEGVARFVAWYRSFYGV